MSDNVYDLITVTIADEEMQARPVEFDLDGSGVPEKPAKYQTTCPRCSQMVEFMMADLKIIDDKKHLQGCEECPVKGGKQYKDPDEWVKPEMPEPTDVDRTRDEVYLPSMGAANLDKLADKEFFKRTARDKRPNTDAPAAPFTNPIATGKLKIEGLKQKDI